MSQFDSTLRLFEELDGLDDAFIEESMLPDTMALTPIRGRRTRRGGQNPLARFMNSGWGVAILCAVVSLGVLTAIVRLGIEDMNVGNSEAPGENRPAGSVDDMLPSETDEPVTLPDESVRVPVGTSSVDESGIQYVSYGDGTCICMGFTAQSGQTALHIPDHSPDGDVVVSIHSYAFRSCLELTEVTLPAGLRELDHKSFPMEADIYHLYGNILYLGSVRNPYMVAVATADNRPGATSLHPHTRIVACHALTYDAGSYFALAWGDKLPAYTDDEVFSIPSGLLSIGEYGLLDVGRDVYYNGYLVGWDALTAAGHRDLIRTRDGSPITVTCLDGETQSLHTEPRAVSVDATAYVADGVLYGGYVSYTRCVNQDYYTWLRDPSAFAEGPDQFITVSAVFGKEPRVLTLGELETVTFLTAGITDQALMSHLEAHNQSPATLYAGKAVVMLYLSEPALYAHAVTSVTAQDGHIHVTLARIAGGAEAMVGNRWILIPVSDPDGLLQNATVSYEIAEEAVTRPVEAN